ncbi:stealth conserved region 3 domain-containing protein [Nocardioides sp.]|uniref:stealth conserved region 3 domain-containing protein n=1 Tax=Nocardioides sp. TaxID=35761 RepID=UPI0027205830|nr:stealth conserved region 3 domain-containing protein [Nocardioides sp.]MDO9457065.1 Stealth CR1 domain-containing protein [Nocardioides sp.]
MKVSFLIATVHDIGGTAGAVVTQANALARRGVDVEILSVFPPEGRTHFPLGPGVVVRDLVDNSLETLRGRTPLLIPDNADPGLDARVDAALEAALPALRSDVLVTVTPAMLTYAVQLAPARTVVVHQEHRSSHSRPNSRHLLLDVARRADVVAMLTEPMAHWLRVELGSDCPEVVVVPNALAPGFRPRSPLTEPVIVGVGRLASEKQWPVLVRAFGAVADRIPEWRLRIFGEGHGRFETMGMVRKLGLYDRVELPGPTSDMQAEWARASLSALTSQPGEGFPLVIQEAMAAGVPVIAYDMPTGPRDQIDHGVDGLLVTQGVEAGLSAAILRLATDPAERLRMGAAALTKAATWDGEAIASRWIEVFEDALRRRVPIGGAAGGTPVAGRTAAVAVGRVDAVAIHQDRAPLGRDGVGVTPEQARHETLAAATALATGLGPLAEGWFVVPGRAGRPVTVVLPMAARSSYVAGLVGLAESGVLPSYVSVHDPEHRGWPSRRGTAAEMVGPLQRARTGRLLLDPWPRTDGPDGERGTLLGRGCEVAVEFWETGPDGDLHAVPGHVTWTTSVPRGATTVPVRVHDVEVPTLAAMAAPTVYDVRFPVDVVYTWVDGSDEAWEARRIARLAEVTGDPTTQTRAASGRARYVDRGELRYSLRSLHLFAPWVRTIHVVTDGQVPAWLDVDHPRIHLVDHRDLLPADALPTFNSHAIESVVHRIDGLAEHFVYFNDDFFVGAPTWPEAFFSPAGSPAVFPSSTVVGLPGQGVLPWALAADNNRRLLSEAFGATTVNTLVHAPYAHRVSTLREVAERYASAVDATTRAPFRSATDVSVLSSLAQHHGLLTGAAHVGETDYAFVDITETVVRRRLIDLLRRERGGFCLGDSHDFGRDPAQVEVLVAEFLEAYFPIAAPWER